MKSLFWKEWRENLRWALIGLVVISAAMAYTLRTDPNDYYGSNREIWQGLQSGQFLMVTVFGFPVIGLALGFLQILTELRRDQWAFLIHRPVTRNEIFWGKAIPGSLLYLVATGLPLLATAWWLSQPGHLAAPFDIRQILPGAVDLLVGLGFYFAALLSGILPGPWYGRRALPLVGACFGTAAAKLPEFPLAIEGVTLTVLVLLLAAWAAYQRFGLFRGQPWWGKAAALLSCLFGLSVLSGWFWVGWNIVQPTKPYTSTNYGFLKSGEVVVITSQANWYKSVVTLDGKEVQPVNKASFDWQDFLNGAYLSIRDYPNYDYYRSPRSYFDFMYVYGGPYSWFYVQKEKRYVAYDRINKLLSGYMGPGGFATPADETKAGHFDKPENTRAWSDSIIIANNGAYVANFMAQTVKNIYPPAPGETITSASQLYPDNGSSEGPKNYVVATPKNLVLLPEGKPSLQIPEVPNIRDYQLIQVYQLPGGAKYILLYSPQNPKKTQNLLREISSNGVVISQRELPNIKEEKAGISFTAWTRGALDPLGARLWGQALLGVNGNTMSKPLWRLAPETRAYQLKFWYASLAASIVCFVLVQIPLRRIQFSGQRIRWSIFVFLFGVGGLLTFYIVQNWPRRVACASCQKKRSTERETCEHCGSSWPAPTRDGTEIFEESQA